jgi:hypothetical protein
MRPGRTLRRHVARIGRNEGSVTDWLRTGPTDGAALVAAVNAATGAGLVHTGRLPGGSAGAVTARRGDHEVVLTVWGHASPEQATLLARLVAAGHPIPAHELVPVPAGVVMVAERIDGVSGARPTPRLVERVLALIDRQAGLADAPDGDLGGLHLIEDGGGYCLHEPLRRHSAATRELLGWIEEVGRTAPADASRGTDVVHYDLHLDNVLVRTDDPEAVAAVVDWAGVRVGDRGAGPGHVRFRREPARRGRRAGPGSAGRDRPRPVSRLRRPPRAPVRRLGHPPRHRRRRRPLGRRRDRLARLGELSGQAGQSWGAGRTARPARPRPARSSGSASGSPDRRSGS